MTDSLLPAALSYAERYGWAVHPVNAKKRPISRHGRNDATRDPATIQRFFQNGAQIGVATGPESGLFVLDVDVKPDKGIDGRATLAALEARYGPLPATPRQRTGSGGEQYLFRHVDGLKNSASTLGPGLDTRGEGGYIVIAPSHNTNGPYTWIVSPDAAPLADVPAWLVELLHKPAQPTPAATTRTTSAPARDLTAYLDRAFRDEVANVATAPDGTKHDTLRDAAIKLGSLIAHGLNEQTITDALYNASSGRAADPKNARDTIQDGIAYGKLHPRTIPDRPRLSSAGTGTLSSAADAAPTQLSRSFVLMCLGMGEAGDAQLVAHLYAGQLCYDHAAGAWYTFTAHHWQRCNGTPRRAIWHRVAAAYLACAADVQARLEHEPDDSKRESGQRTVKLLMERAGKLRSVSRINNVLTLAQELLGITGSEWDADPWLLGVENGVLDLRTGELRDGRPDDYLRTVAPTEWRGLGEGAPRWERFVSEVMSDEPERVAFLQRLLGYALNGSTREHLLAVCVGARGRNGKRVLFETLQRVLGGYAQSVSTDVLIGQEHKRIAGSAQPHLMELQGKRLAYCSETGEHDRLSTAQVKNITGGDPITARWLHENLVTFLPTHTMFLQTNRKPQAPADDDALWERVKVIEFKVRFVDEPSAPDERPRDPQLEETLGNEASGILAWLMRGGLAWLKGGLQTPASVRLARDTYRLEESIEPFLAAACVEAEGLQTEGGALYAAYESWCKANGLRSKTPQWFGRQIGGRFEKGRTSSGRICYYGLGLETTEFPDDTPENNKKPSGGIRTHKTTLTQVEPYTVFEGLASISNSFEPILTHEGENMKSPSEPSEPSEPSGLPNIGTAATPPRARLVRLRDGSTLRELILTEAWQDVPDGWAIPAGAESAINVTTGTRRARLAPAPDAGALPPGYTMQELGGRVLLRHPNQAATWHASPAQALAAAQAAGHASPAEELR